ncbi:MAG: hypothetical protein ACI4XI_07865 [Ruminococcus sp.]
MPDVSYGSEQMPLNDDRTPDSGCDAICIDADRIYDSCGAKDCLSDLPLMFTESEQALIENACSVRINRANIITSTVEVEPVAFHRGFYSVDMTFYFSVSCDVYSSNGALPTTVNGLAVYGKRVVLYGSDGSVKSFSSDKPVKCEKKDRDCSCSSTNSVPKATVQISNPMALSAKLVNCKPCSSMPCKPIPHCVCDYFCGELVPCKKKQIAVTIGIFTITRLQRKVQIMIPSYDFCVPRKECCAKTDDPCEVFSKIEFPTDSFFPRKSEECEKHDKPFECGREE